MGLTAFTSSITASKALASFVSESKKIAPAIIELIIIHIVL